MISSAVGVCVLAFYRYRSAIFRSEVSSDISLSAAVVDCRTNAVTRGNGYGLESTQALSDEYCGPFSSIKRPEL
jgi:hypothetical protein